MNEFHNSIQKLFELRSYADIRAMKMRKTSLSFLRLEDGTKMITNQTDPTCDGIVTGIQIRGLAENIAA